MSRLVVGFGLAVVAGMGTGEAAEPETAWRPGQPQVRFRQGDQLRVVQKASPELAPRRQVAGKRSPPSHFPMNDRRSP